MSKINNTSAKKKKIQRMLNQAVNHQAKKNFISSEVLLQKILTLDPNHAGAYHYLALISQEFNDFKTACSLMITSIHLNPNNADVYYNFGVIQDKLQLHQFAIESYEHAVQIDKKMAFAWFNLANSYLHNHQNDQVFYALKHLLAIEKYPKSFYPTIAKLYFELGDTKTSQEFCMKTLKLRIDYEEALWTWINTHFYQHTPQKTLQYINESMNSSLSNELKMRLTIYQAVAEWQLGKLEDCQRSINLTERWNENFKLTPVNSSLLSYRDFLQELLMHIKNNPPSTTHEENIYMIGDSHTLSNTHQILCLNKKRYLAHSRLCIGCKAFHFTQTHNNQFKTSFNKAIDSIPDSSSVIIMFGEIDCRANEGILPAFLKADKDLSVMIQEQVEAYVTYALKQTSKKNFDVYFYGVPAPRLIVDFSNEKMEILKNIVYVFNQYLQHYALQSGSKFIDIYQLTVGDNGLSDGRYHIQDSHLLPKCIEAADLLFITDNASSSP